MTIQNDAYVSQWDRTDSQIDAGLRDHMRKTYLYLTLGILITGITAWWFADAGYAASVFGAGRKPGLLGLAIILAPLAYVFAISGALQRRSLGFAHFLFWSFTAVEGLSLSTILLHYTGASILTTFLTTGIGFASLSLWGYTTKRDLGPVGSFCIMGLFGLIAALVINLFVGSQTADYVTSIVGLLIFAGLTAFDNQKIKSLYLGSARSADTSDRLAIFGALQLYLDALNMFLFLLRFMGVRKN